MHDNIGHGFINGQQQVGHIRGGHAECFGRFLHKTPDLGQGLWFGGEANKNEWSQSELSLMGFSSAMETYPM